MIGRPLRRVYVELAGVDRDDLCGELIDDRRITEGVTPMPTAAVSIVMSRPKISQMQISADRSGSSSYPIIHSATMERGSSIALARTRRNRTSAVQPHVVLCLP